MSDRSSLPLLGHTSEHELVRRALEYLNEAIPDAPTQAELAAILGVSSRQLATAFRRVLALSFSEYVRAHRIRIAQRLLLQTSMSMHEIADHLAFSSAANFSSAFRRHTGKTPSEFRDTSTLSDLLSTDERWG